MCNRDKFRDRCASGGVRHALLRCAGFRGVELGRGYIQNCWRAGNPIRERSAQRILKAAARTSGESWKALESLFNSAGYSSITFLGSRPSMYRRASIYAALIEPSQGVSVIRMATPSGSCGTRRRSRDGRALTVRRPEDLGRRHPAVDGP